jgi:hypothetical protein
MRAAAIVYLVSAIAVLGLDLYSVIAAGVGVGSVVLALVAVALLVIAHGLIGGTARASHCAIVASSFVAVGFVLVPLYCYAQGGWAAVAVLWLVLSPFVAVAISHSLALVFLFRSKASAP